MSVLQAGQVLDKRLSSSIRAACRLCLYILFTLAILPLQILAVLFSAKLKIYIPVFYHKLCIRIFGIKLRVHGKNTEETPVLYVSNHVSYSDISILGSLIEASFVSKAEVSRWPLFGQLAKLNRTVFIQRRRSLAADQRDHLSRRLANGDNLILFPEGTSADGVHVLPFKSTLFSVASQNGHCKTLFVQPVSISYTCLDGIPISRVLLPYIAWYGKMKLVPHLFTFLGLGSVTVDVKFHTPIPSSQFKDRKEIAEYCQSVISAGANRSNYGRRK